MLASELPEVLNHLIESSKDREALFAEAAQRVSDIDLSRALNEYSNECAREARQLQDEVVRLGEEPYESGTLGGATRRGWLNLKWVFADDEQGQIEECSRLECEAVREYRRALRMEMPEKLRELLRHHYQHAESACKYLREGLKTA